MKGKQTDKFNGDTVSSKVSSTPNSIGPVDMFDDTESTQYTVSEAYKKEFEVKRRIGRFIFSAGLPFNVVKDPNFLPMVDAIAAYGRGFKPPSMHELKTRILKAEVEDINNIFGEHKKIWQKFGCTIMSDSWTDGKDRALMNFIVNSQTGTFFLKSVDVSDTIKNGELLFDYLDDVVQLIGEENVLQVVTNNDSDCEKAGKKLMETRKKLWWTPCAASCIDLMLEDIAKLKIFAETIEMAKRVVKFIYGHAVPLSLMREFTNHKELIRPAVTRSATTFLTLQSLYKQKRPLEVMFSSEKWVNSPHAQELEGKLVKRIVLNDPKFWPHVSFCVKSVAPLVCVLREVVDSEVRPAMGYIYELMNRAKEQIKLSCGGISKKYGPIWKKIDTRWAPQLHHPLYAAGYYLNPQFRYEEKFSDSLEIRNGLYACMDRMLSWNDRLKADIQLDLYNSARDEFGCPMAKKTRMLQAPASWWERFGNKTPELTNFAIRVLNLTCSASGCERNWSTFESIHSKKRNRLEHKRLNALVYVKYNLKLRERSIKKRDNVDPIIVDDMESDDEWITEKEDPALPTDPSWLEDDELFWGDPIVNVPFDSDFITRVPVVDDFDPSPVSKKQKVCESSSEFEGINPKNFDNGDFPEIDTSDI